MCNIPGFQNQFMALQTPLDPLHPTSSSFTFLRILSDFAVGGSEEKFSFLASLLVFLSFNYDMIFMDNLGWEWLKVFALFLASGVLGSDGGQEGEMVSGSWRGRSCENLSRPTMLYQYEDQQDESGDKDEDADHCGDGGKWCPQHHHEILSKNIA